MPIRRAAASMDSRPGAWKGRGASKRRAVKRAISSGLRMVLGLLIPVVLVFLFGELALHPGFEDGHVRVLGVPALAAEGGGVDHDSSGRSVACLGAGPGGASKSPNCSLVAARRFTAIAWYFGSRSHPMNERPRRLQATPVVPLPAKGSRMVSPASVKSRTRASMRSRGFCVVWTRSSPAPRL